MENNPWLWKPKKYRVCKTGGMTLWVALQLLSPRAIEMRNPTREEYKAAVLSFPNEVSDCRCKDCRYYRIAKRKI